MSGTYGGKLSATEIDTAFGPLGIAEVFADEELEPIEWS